MKILVINSGSSSLKYELFQMEQKKTLRSLTAGMIDRIGLPESCTNHKDALKKSIAEIIKSGKINNLKDIGAIGHRVVHGGEKFKHAVKITKKIEKEIKILSRYAPLHQKANLQAIKACQTLFPHTPQIAVFDTAFHQTIPEKAYLYAIPLELYTKKGIRRYGFHGTSHHCVSKVASEIASKKHERIITCHLGNGCSITAINKGKSIDTSMGFTPLEGLPMGTRSGDIDPAIALELSKTMSPEKAEKILNHESGLKAISGISSDMRDIWEASKSNKRARLAMYIMAYKTAKYIGSYMAALNGLDILVFTGGIGENAYYLRDEICAYLSFAGIKLDNQKNKSNETVISAKNSQVEVMVIPTDEEKEIAFQTGLVLNIETN